VIEQIGWKVDTTDQFQLRQFLLHAGEAGPPRIAAQRQERRRRAARGVFTSAEPSNSSRRSRIAGDNRP